MVLYKVAWMVSEVLFDMVIGHAEIGVGADVDSDVDAD